MGSMTVVRQPAMECHGRITAETLELA